VKSHNYANRRFIRIQAFDDLYSFYTLRSANYDLCVNSIKSQFIYNTLADPLQDKKSLEDQCEQALHFFDDLILRGGDINKVTHSNSTVSSTALSAYYTYKSFILNDFQNIKLSLSKLETDVNLVCLSIIQLLLEWKKLSNREELYTVNKQEQIQLFTKLNSNTILQKIAIDRIFQEAIKQYNIDWRKNLYLVEDWFDTINTSPEAITQLCQIQEENLFLESLIKSAVLKSTFVTDFFANQNLSWHKIQPQLKDTLMKILSFYTYPSDDKSKNLKECLFGINMQNKEFHTKLLDTLIEKETEIEDILENRLKNWTLDRVVFLDRIIAKLAICEILYFIEIPKTVSINEYIDIAKLYGNAQSGKFINGILDTLEK
jgi:N utilization substance protein B